MHISVLCNSKMNYSLKLLCGILKSKGNVHYCKFVKE